MHACARRTPLHHHIYDIYALSDDTQHVILCTRVRVCTHVCDCAHCACRGRSLCHLCVYFCVRVCLCLSYCLCANQMAKAYDNARQELTELARIKNDFMEKIELAGRDSGARRSPRARRAPPPPHPLHPRPPGVKRGVCESMCGVRRQKRGVWGGLRGLLLRVGRGDSWGLGRGAAHCTAGPVSILIYFIAFMSSRNQLS